MTKSIEEPLQLIFVRRIKGDVVVRCPVCGFEGPLMRDFSLLKAGFNGIKRGDPDDCDLQECGWCDRRSKWDKIPVVDQKDET